MRHARLTLALGLAVLTAACGKKGETPVTTETNQAAPAETMSGDMGNMSMAPDANAAIKAKGHGTVTAIDKTAGTITLNHGPIPEAKWPAMTMDFTLADPALFDGITPGTAARFEFRQGAPGEFVITRIERLPAGTAARTPSASRAGTDRHEGH